MSPQEITAYCLDIVKWRIKPELKDFKKPSQNKRLECNRDIVSDEPHLIVMQIFCDLLLSSLGYYLFRGAARHVSQVPRMNGEFIRLGNGSQCEMSVKHKLQLTTTTTFL